jgi:hypothetical protein
MSVKKKPQMSPVRRGKGAETGRLMDNQDMTARGDGVKVQKVNTNILLPVDLKESAQAYARDNGLTLTTLIIEGLRDRINDD